MAKQLEDKDVLLASASEESTRLQAAIQEGRTYVSNLDGQLQSEKSKTAHLESAVQSMRTELQAFKSQLDLLNQKAEAELPERVSALLSINDRKCRGKVLGAATS